MTAQQQLFLPQHCMRFPVIVYTQTEFIQPPIQHIPILPHKSLPQQIMDESSPYDRINLPRSMPTSHCGIVKNHRSKLICGISRMRYVLSDGIVRGLSVGMIGFLINGEMCVGYTKLVHSGMAMMSLCCVHDSRKWLFAQAIIVFILQYLCVCGSWWKIPSFPFRRSHSPSCIPKTKKIFLKISEVNAA